MDITGGGAVPPVSEQSADQGQVLAGHDGMAGIGVTEVVQSQPAQTRTLAYGAPACCEPELPRPWAYRGNRKASARRSPGSASSNALAPSPRGTVRGPVIAVGKANRFRFDVAPSQVEHFAAPAVGERQQADRSDRIGPFGLAGVEGAAQTVEFGRARAIPCSAQKVVMNRLRLCSCVGRRVGAVPTGGVSVARCPHGYSVTTRECRKPMILPPLAHEPGRGHR